MSFEKIHVDDLNRYPKTLLADQDRLETYWRSSLNAYFFSRDLDVFEHVILPFYTSLHSTSRIKRPGMIWLSEKLFQGELSFYNLLEYYQVLIFGNKKEGWILAVSREMILSIFYLKIIRNRLPLFLFCLLCSFENVFVD